MIAEPAQKTPKPPAPPRVGAALHYAIDGDLRFTRTDTGAPVEVACHQEIVERPKELKTLMHSALGPASDADARRAFGETWQEWVRRIVIDHADDPALVTVVG